MKLPRPHFTLRQMISLVAILAIGLSLVAWMARRSAAFHIEAATHAERLRLASTKFPADMKLIEHHQILFLKYDHAGRYPWLPVEVEPIF